MLLKESSFKSSILFRPCYLFVDVRTAQFGFDLVFHEHFARLR